MGIAASLLCSSLVEADALRVITTHPASAWRELADMEVVIHGSGFQSDSSVAFLVSGTDEQGGVTVTQLRISGPHQLIAHVRIDASATPGAFDIQVQNSSGHTVRAAKAFVIEPYTWAGRFGCTGAESWRRRIPCKRGTIY